MRWLLLIVLLLGLLAGGGVAAYFLVASGPSVADEWAPQPGLAEGTAGRPAERPAPAATGTPPVASEPTLLAQIQAIADSQPQVLSDGRRRILFEGSGITGRVLFDDGHPSDADLRIPWTALRDDPAVVDDFQGLFTALATTRGIPLADARRSAKMIIGALQRSGADDPPIPAVVEDGFRLDGDSDGLHLVLTPVVTGQVY